MPLKEFDKEKKVLYHHFVNIKETPNLTNKKNPTSGPPLSEKVSVLNKITGKRKMYSV